jgi:hypothetical protein
MNLGVEHGQDRPKQVTGGTGALVHEYDTIDADPGRARLLDEDQRRLEARQKSLGIPMEQELVEISHQPARYKEEASLQYRSQIPANFGTEDRMRQSLTTYSSSIRRTYPGIQIERYWTW